MFFYEYEYHVQNLIDILKEKQEAEEGTGSNSREDMMNDAKKLMPSGTNLPSMKTPTYSPSSFPSIPSSLKI